MHVTILYPGNKTAIDCSGRGSCYEELYEGLAAQTSETDGGLVMAAFYGCRLILTNYVIE